MRPQKLVTLDVEGVLIPEVWINLARRTGIDDLLRTTEGSVEAALQMIETERRIADEA